MSKSTVRHQRSIIRCGQTTLQTAPVSNKYWRQVSTKTLIIIPTYNEIDNLPPLLKEIFSYAPEIDVLIVDDNSPDGTGKLADEIHATMTSSVLHRAGKLGLGNSLY